MSQITDSHIPRPLLHTSTEDESMKPIAVRTLPTRKTLTDLHLGAADTETAISPGRIRKANRTGVAAATLVKTIHAIELAPAFAIAST